MASTMQFELVSPERRVASMEVDSVELPGSEGDMTVMAGHASLVTTLRPGILRAHSGDSSVEHVVTGGFVEVTASAASVLADVVLSREEATPEALQGLVAEEENAAKSLTGALKDASDIRVACLKALAGRLN